MNNYPDWLASTLASDAAEGQGVLLNGITPLKADSVVVGPAFVVLVSQNDNQALREALLAPPPPRSILVIAGGGASRTAVMGGIMALEMEKLGIVGVVTDALVRDAREINQLQLGVWCRGLTPSASTKKGPVEKVETVSLGGVIIRNGDLIIADLDGVVIWPKENISELLGRAEARFHSDNARVAKFKAGSPEIKGV